MSNKSQHQIQFCVFDILYLNGEKMTELPLLHRKEWLTKVMPDNDIVVPVQWTHCNRVKYFDLVQQLGLEGIVLKKSDSTYQIKKRSADWLKVINYQYSEALITGVRKDQFGLLLMFEAGVMEFMPPNNRKELYEKYKVIEENDKFKYIDPIKCRVKYRNLTKDGKLRIPSFIEWTG